VASDHALSTVTKPRRSSSRSSGDGGPTEVETGAVVANSHHDLSSNASSHQIASHWGPRPNRSVCPLISGLIFSGTATFCRAVDARLRLYR
jgi:hypothetical protein